MNSYFVTFDSRVNNLLSTRVLYGKSPLDAAKRAYPDLAVNRVKWEDVHYADLIISVCTVKPNGAIYRPFGARTYCYNITRNERG